jgi:hypothetical protein
MPSRKIHDADEARQFLAAATASGLPRAAWARQHGICARSLNCWRLAVEPSTLSPIRVVELVQNPALAEHTESGSYRVRTGVFEVEVPSGFQADVLTRLLRAVAAAC